MSAAKKPTSSTRKPRRVILLLAIIAACLLAVLALLPARRRPGSGALPPGREHAGRGEASSQAGQRQRAAAAAYRAQPAARARIAVVIDDVGYDLDNLQQFLLFPAPIALSVLPNLPYSEESARRIVEAGKELLLHMPMEARSGEDPGPGAIRTGQGDEEIRRLLEAGFSQVPGAGGMNNHMGSLATADRRVMSVVMEYLATHGRFYLDSRTTVQTLGASAAAVHGVPFLERDVFLDNEPAAGSIEKELDRGIELAEEKGQAVLIGHVRNPQILEILKRRLVERKADVELVRLSALLEPAGAKP
jgi:polysaccharide deacetylase 2 family uncharacterized protein YibQ